MMDAMERKFDEKLGEMNEKDRRFFKNVKKWTFGLYDTIKPLLIGILMFWLFTRIKNVVGIQEATFYLMILQLIFLRVIASRLG